MKKFISFALAMALTATLQATPPSKAAAASKAPSNTTPASTPAAQTGAGNTAAPNGNSNWVCPPGIKPESGKCFARPTKSAQK